MYNKGGVSMSYLVLARKYRPQSFNDVYAQDHITRILTNAIEKDRIAHAYLFTGPRGVGKTSLARILAKGLNCIEGPTATPCNVCDNCREITAGVSSDVTEIDGASNTGVDDVRDLQKELMYSTNKSKFRIYIIDEVHMLSKSAFNALLKTLEEPPEQVIFIFATTEPHKVLPTIISRCQRFDCKRIPIESIVKRLQDICVQEKIHAEEEALFQIAKKADGGMRDALSLMDQVISYGQDEISLSLVENVFGILPWDTYQGLLEAIITRQPASMITLLHEVMERGADLQEFLNGVLDFTRNLLLVKLGVATPEIPNMHVRDMQTLAKQFEANTLIYITSLLIKLKQDLKESNTPVLLAEMVFVKLSRIQEMYDLEKVLQFIAQGKALPIQEVSYIQTGTKQETDCAPAQDPATSIPAKLVAEVKEEQVSFPELTMEFVSREWSNLLEQLKKELGVAAVQLQNCTLVGVINNMIQLNTSNSMSFKSIENNKSQITETLKRFFNKDVKLSIKHVPHKEDPYQEATSLKAIADGSSTLSGFIKVMEENKVNLNFEQNNIPTHK